MIPTDFIVPSLGLFILVAIVLVWQILVLRKRINSFLKKGDLSFEKTLRDLIKDFGNQEKETKKILERVNNLESIAKISIQKTGVVRYSPFKTIGGDQSFSLALLDEDDNGLVLTSLYLKGEHRTFAKPIKNGKSEYSLSKEELDAIEKAREISN